MASSKASIASSRPYSKRKYSTDHYQRQAEISLRIEEGRSRRPPRLSTTQAVKTLFEDFELKPRTSVEPTSLTRADTFPHPPESPLAEYHPGNRVTGPRRLTVQDVQGAFVKPFTEPVHVEERLSSKVDAFDAENALPQMQPLASDASRKNNPARRLYHKLLGRSATIKPSAPTGLEFVASLPTANAATIISNDRILVEERRMIYVLEYKLESNGIISCAPPNPFESVESLRRYLEDGPTSALRLIYTCNHDEAINFLSSEFGISSASTEVGERSFREWMHGERDSRRANNKAIRWRPGFDTARRAICSAFAVDFGSVLVTDAEIPHSSHPNQSFLYESSHRQRIAVYMQRPIDAKYIPPRTTRFNTGAKSLPSYAITPTIIMCESSSAGVGEVVSIAPLLGLDLPSHSSGVLSDAVNHAFESILLHITDGILRFWEQQISLLHEPHAELEDSIWSRPADSSRAREVWSMSQRLHTMLKHVNRHAKMVEAVQDDFQVFSERGDEQEWAEHVLDEFEHLVETIRVDYLEPLEHMIDLMYKSVAIRDARQSLELNASLWRLSWITFIFLPLTFLSGFFGMNVKLFKNFPSIKWYFVAIIPLLVFVLAFWFTFRSFGPGSRRAKEEYSRQELREAGVFVRKGATAKTSS